MRDQGVVSALTRKRTMHVMLSGGVAERAW